MPKKKLHSITADEWHMIKEKRGENSTGYPLHEYYHDNSILYYWPWGKQPDLAVVKKIGAECPAKAARLFLGIYIKNPSGDFNAHYQPVKKKNANQGKSKKGR